MCGRYTLMAPVEALAEEFGLTGPLPEFPASYNVAPTQEVAAVLVEDDERHLALLRWGLIPSWADDPQIGARMINARGETVAEKPSFRGAFKKRRCLIPVDGFYEWQRTDNGKQPYYIRMKNGRPFAFAGLWENWNGNGHGIRSCTIITTEANDIVGEVHHRMPVIVAPDNYETWLDPDIQEAELLTPLLAPYYNDPLETYPVSRFVNNPANNAPGCIESLA